MEKERILNNKSEVKCGYIDGELRISRSLGSFQFKENDKLKPEEQAIICTPFVTSRSRNSSDKYILIACDGIWDSLENKECITFINNKINQQKINEVMAKIDKIKEQKNNKGAKIKDPKMNFAWPVEEMFRTIMAPS